MAAGVCVVPVLCIAAAQCSCRAPALHQVGAWGGAQLSCSPPPATRGRPRDREGPRRPGGGESGETRRRLDWSAEELRGRGDWEAERKGGEAPPAMPRRAARDAARDAQRRRERETCAGAGNDEWIRGNFGYLRRRQRRRRVLVSTGKGESLRATGVAGRRVSRRKARVCGHSGREAVRRARARAVARLRASAGAGRRSTRRAAALVQGLARAGPGVVARVLWLEEQACCVPVLLAKWICCLLVSCLSAASLGEERERRGREEGGERGIRCWCVCCSAEEGGAGACVYCYSAEEGGAGVCAARLL
ncbi:hypothetical protein BDA96_10G220600 [Sorghum bicolor]|uniref:Uncharacterized protein n=1 Tax=Sorghum bicolor TaxID=4558 RepID=A0A921Q3C8_SORBI|nr:hypothetical protein BDA96_10G220600 [Sorghum bicolor]